MKQNKPKAQIIGADGNIFNLIGIASKALKNEGLHEQAQEMTTRIYASQSYEEALYIITEYVEPIAQDHNYDGMDFQ